MKLSKLAIVALRGSGIDFIGRIAAKRGVTIRTVNRWIRENDDTLTKAETLQMIREEFGLDNSQILEEEKIEQQ